MIEDVQDIVKSFDREMQEDYVRISKNASKDPGTAGDQGQANWQELLKKWLPSYFKIVVNGRVVSNKSTDSPQIDIIILRPEYPDILIEKKVFVADGIIAMFECKTTLRREDIKKTFQNSERLSNHFEHLKGTFRNELNRPFIYGMICHSHEWKGKNSNPVDNISNALNDNLAEITSHPRNMLDFLCVADLGFWKSLKSIQSASEYTMSKVNNTDFKPTGTTQTAYMCHADKVTVPNQTFSPQGNLLSFLFQRLSWQFDGLKPLSQLFSKSGTTSGGKTQRLGQIWTIDIFSEELKNRSCFGPFSESPLNDEWSWAFM